MNTRTFSITTTSPFQTRLADAGGKARKIASLEAKRFLQSTLDALTAHIAILDEYGIIIEVNAAWIRFAQENDFVGDQHGLGDDYLSLCETAAGDFSEGALEMAKGIRAVMAGQNDEFYLEYPCHSPQQQRWFIGRATRFTGDGPVRVVVAHENTTQRKQAEPQFRMISEAVEQSPVSIVITDLLGGIEYVNRKFCSLTGYSFEDVRGKNPRVLKSGEMPAESYQLLWNTINAGEEWRGEFHNRKKDGELYWESASISAIRDDQGRVTHFLAVKEDITEHKRTVVALREAEESYRALFDRSLDCVFIHDFEGRFLDFNPAALALLGYERGDLVSLTFTSLLIPSHIPRALRMIEEVRASGTQMAALEFTVRRKDGRYVDVETKASLVMRNGQPHSILGIARDITTRRRTEEALQGQLELRERLAKIAANVPGIIFSFRLRPNGASCVPYASPTIGEFLGLRAEDLVADASPLFDLIPAVDLARVHESIAESALAMLPWRAEFRLRHPQKGVFWIEGQSTPEREADGSILWHGFMSDITGRKQAEETLSKIELRLAHAMRLAQLVEWEYDVATKLFTFSDRYYALHGTTTELEGGNLMSAEDFAHKFMHADDVHLVVDEVAKCVATADPNYVSQLECRILRWKGDLRHVLVHIAIIKDAAGRTIQLRGANQDITERKQAQAEREKLERILEHYRVSEESTRLALEHEQRSSQIKDRFVSLVSHEFRTPLSIINMAAELLDGYLDKMTDAERSEHLNEIKSSVERMTQMMTDFLVHGNCTSGKMKCKPARVDVEALCRRLIAEMPGYPGRSGSIECVVDPAVGETFLDEKIFRHILGNLLSNAVKYSSDGQPVKLGVKRVAGHPQLTSGSLLGPETHLEIRVSDSGIGIPAPDMAKLYQTFHRAANVGNRPGTGMGLAIVKQFVDLHQGAIRFESEEGKGTTVWVELPIAVPVVPAGFPAVCNGQAEPVNDE